MACIRFEATVDLGGPQDLRDRERVRRDLHASRPAAAESGRGRPVPVQTGRELGPVSNVFLENGARLYLDVGSHPEYATPECDSIEDLVAHDKAGERILDGLVASAEARLRDEGIRGVVYLFKNNTDSAGNSYGCHENYLTSRRDDFAHYAQVLIPFLVTRQIYCRRRQGAADGPRARCSASPSGPSTSGKASRPRRPAAGRSSTPGTSRTPTPSASAGCTSSSATRT